MHAAGRVDADATARSGAAADFLHFLCACHPLAAAWFGLSLAATGAAWGEKAGLVFCCRVFKTTRT